ncbi:MAG: MFS transporter [Kiritimatiellae bacterium]|nr:MFS transporter [Kiritimatiellia bacterium]
MKSVFSLAGVVCAVSLGGLLFGFDTGVISGCEEAIQAEFSLSPFWHGLVVAGALLGTVFGAPAAGRMCDRMGRKPTLVWTGVLFFVSAAGCALTPGGAAGPAFLGIMRFIGGVAIGGVSVAVPMYIAEIAPPERRGRLVLVNQFCIVLGIVVSYVSNYCVAKWLPFSPSVVWRAMLGAECVPAALYLAALAHVPESPYQARVTAGAPLFARRNLRPILLCFTVAFFSQLSGINAVNYYAPRIFKMIFGDGSELVSLAGTIGVGVVNLVFTVAAFFLIDRFGRKPLLVSGCAAMAAMHGLVAWQISLGTACTPWLAMLGIYGFIAAVAFSASAVIWVFISEIFPPDVRAKGQSFGGTVHWVMCMLVSWLFPVAVARTGTGAFAFFAAMMLLEAVWAVFFMPETKGKAIDAV